MPRTTTALYFTNSSTAPATKPDSIVPSGRILETNSVAKRNWLLRWEPHSCAQSPASQTRIPSATRWPTSRTGYPSWRRINRLVVHAAANAQRAVDLILCTSFENVDANEELTTEAVATAAAIVNAQCEALPRPPSSLQPSLNPTRP